MNEQWKKWEPISGLVNKYNVTFISEDMKKDGKFIIILEEYENEKKGVRITWDQGPWAFRITYESFCLKLIYDLNQKYGSNFYVNWTFFKVENSEYSKWLSEQSYQVTDSLKFQHFVIFTPEELIDIVNWSEPKLEFIDL